jgi:predicted nucleotidyltransferase
MDNSIIHKINNYFIHELVDKAWIFGSFSRNEEKETSDIDLLVQFSKNQKITLFYYLKLKNKLEELTGKKVDLIEEGQLKIFARAGFEKDKILIYERKNQGQ